MGHACIVSTGHTYRGTFNHACMVVRIAGYLLNHIIDSLRHNYCSQKSSQGLASIQVWMVGSGTQTVVTRPTVYTHRIYTH